MEKDKNDRILNNQVSQKCVRNQKENLFIKWQDIKIGDILYLSKNEYCPADVIILDTNIFIDKNAVCYVDTHQVDGKLEMTLKKASILTQVGMKQRVKNNFQEYRKILTGKLEYEFPKEELSKFNGYLKLKKDPKIETLTIENFIPRGSIIKGADWLFAIVVFTGKDTKIMKNINKKAKKKSVFQYNNTVYFMTSLAIFFGVGMVNLTFFYLNQENTFKYNEDYNSKSNLIFQFPTLIPLFITFGIDILDYLNKLKIEIQNRKQKGLLKILQPSFFSNTCAIENVFIDKTGTLTKMKYNIEGLFFNNKIYNFNEQNLQEMTKNRQKNLQKQVSLPKEKVKPQKNDQQEQIPIMEYSLNIPEDPVIINSVFLQKNYRLNHPKLISNETLFESKNQDHQIGLREDRLNIQDDFQSNQSQIDNQQKLQDHEAGDNLQDKQHFPKLQTPQIEQKQEKTINIQQLFQESGQPYCEKDFSTDLDQNCEKIFDNLMEGLTICQNARTFFQPETQKRLFEASRKEEETILNFCQQF